MPRFSFLLNVIAVLALLLSFPQTMRNPQVDPGEVKIYLPIVVSNNAPLIQSNRITAGSFHTCALTSAGGVKCWGYNGDGELGDNTKIDRHIPVGVPGLDSGIKAIAAGGAHTCVLTNAGGVMCWGSNQFGQLGDGFPDSSLSPVNVYGLTSGVIAIATGYYHTCALTSIGRVECWGNNGVGELGDGTTTNRPTPVIVQGLTSGVSAITAGYSHTCALIAASGAVMCWGDNQYGKLGDGTTDRRSSPVQVVGLNGAMSAIAAGYGHTCALTVGGGSVIKCWGWNNHGQLGNGNAAFSLTPLDVQGLNGAIGAITAGFYHNCALTKEGGMKCWGNNSYGQIGDASKDDRFTAVDVDELTSGVSAITAGRWHTCALTQAGGVKCWGGNDNGELGDNTTTGHPTPEDVIGFP